MGRTGLPKISGVRGVKAVLAGLFSASISGVVPIAFMAPSSASVASSLASVDLAAGVSPGDMTRLSDTALTQQVAGIKASGAQWIRLGAYWGQVEWTRGSISWASTDRVINAALAAGIANVEFVIDTWAPPWALNPDGSPNAAEYAAFAAATVQRYAPRGIHVYEIGNEPNLGKNWNHATGVASPSQYTALLQTAYPSIHANDPAATVLMGGISPAGDTATNLSPRSWLSGLYANGAAASFDAVNVHPYTWPAAPTDALSWSFFYNLPTWIYQVMASNGDGAKKVWMTEFGFPTGYYSNAVTTQQQAAYTTSAFEQAKQWSWAGPLFVYNWQDGTDGAWDTFGLLYSDGTAKAALASFATEARSLRVTLTRIYGQDAVDTSIAVSNASFPRGSAGAVVLARSDFFSDGLAGGPLAAEVSGPLLITPGTPASSILDPRVEAEIQRVLGGGSTVYLLGGPLALSVSIDRTLEGLGYRVVRLAGENAAATAVAIAGQLGNPTTVFETTGTSFYDALSAVPAVIGAHGSILLTNGPTQTPETAAYLATHPSDLRYAIGGPHAAYGADPGATPVYGDDLYGTSAAVASRFFAHPSTFGAATSASFPDALGAGPMLGAAHAPMLLVPSSGPLPAPISPYLSGVANAITSGTVFGGPLAVADHVLAALHLIVSS